jgi:hypothetical protein
VRQSQIVERLSAFVTHVLAHENFSCHADYVDLDAFFFQLAHGLVYIPPIYRVERAVDDKNLPALLCQRTIIQMHTRDVKVEAAIGSSACIKITESESPGKHAERIKAHLAP